MKALETAFSLYKSEAHDSNVKTIKNLFTSIAYKDGMLS